MRKRAATTTSTSTITTTSTTTTYYYLGDEEACRRRGRLALRQEAAHRAHDEFRGEHLPDTVGRHHDEGIILDDGTVGDGGSGDDAGVGAVEIAEAATHREAWSSAPASWPGGVSSVEPCWLEVAVGLLLLCLLDVGAWLGLGLGVRVRVRVRG